MDNQIGLKGKPVLKSGDDKKFRNYFRDLIGVFKRPIIVMPGYEDMHMPQDLKASINLSRLCELIKRNKTNAEPLATDEEAMWYISTASFIAPLDTHHYNIFMWLTRNYMKSKKVEPLEFLKDIPERLDEYEADQLNRLKRWIYKKGNEVFLEKFKAKEKEEAESKEKSKQMILGGE